MYFIMLDSSNVRKNLFPIRTNTRTWPKERTESAL